MGLDSADHMIDGDMAKWEPPLIKSKIPGKCRKALRAHAYRINDIYELDEELMDNTLAVFPFAQEEQRSIEDHLAVTIAYLK